MNLSNIRGIIRIWNLKNLTPAVIAAGSKYLALNNTVFQVFKVILPSSIKKEMVDFFLVMSLNAGRVVNVKTAADSAHLLSTTSYECTKIQS
jgi:hypothetical protein